MVRVTRCQGTVREMGILEISGNFTFLEMSMNLFYLVINNYKINLEIYKKYENQRKTRMHEIRRLTLIKVEM